MGIFIFLAVVQVLSLNEAFDFSCPSQSQWKLRAQSLCKPSKNYTCLYYQTLKVNEYQDRCSKPRIEAPGYRFIFQPNLNRAKCSITRYQPFIFDTVGNSDCNFLKSVCNSEGQMTYENGNTISDRTCICNNYNGYTFVKKPMNQSFCKPFSEDCSCFVSIHPNNKSNCSLDVKCSVEIDSMTNRSLEYMFNISQLLDNNRYNLDSPTHAMRTKIPAIVLIILVLCYLVALWIYILQTNIEQVVTDRLSEEEEEEEERKKREKVISSEMENRHFLRIMIVGKERVGKTCLLKRLLNESIDKVSSTDGVQVVVRQCKIDIKDGKWIIGKDKSNDKKDRLDRAFAKSKTKKAFNIPETELHISKNLQDAGDNTPDDKPIDDKYAGEKTDKTMEAIEFSKQETNDTINTKSIINHKESETDIQNIVKTNDNIQRDIKRNDYKQLLDTSNDNPNEAKSSKKDYFIGKQDKTRTETIEESEEIQVERKTQPLEMPSDLMSNIYSNSSKEDSKSESQYAPCGLWDFAGQREFYATHQAFLTNSCIYILVASMKEEVEKKNVSFTEFGNLGEYVDFWFDNIHCHQSEEKSVPESLDPPVILVFTETDQYTKVGS
ncbi:uncharacterized protein LOC134727678 [Mytilus trossulus]|uniref:uncharacterized protein LOC134727678 n=1 Tax=Mytilus trossulus TaxID=6551 RepID=UPI0030064888